MVKHGGILNPMEQSYPSNEHEKERTLEKLEITRMDNAPPLLLTVRNVISASDAFAGEVVNVEHKLDGNEDFFVKLDSAFPKRRLYSVNAAFLGTGESLINKLNAYTMDAVDSSGCTALIKAAYKGHRNIVVHLINIGADMNVMDGTGVSVSS
jgi:hypothetical protein